MTSQQLTGVPSNYAVPATLIELRFGQGPAGGSTGAKEALIWGNALASLSADCNIVYGINSTPPCRNEQDVIDLFGSGSEIHREYMRWVKVNQSTPVNLIATLEGDGASAASKTVTLGGTATGPGVARVIVEDDAVDVAISTGDALATIAAAAVQATNDQSKWPVTAAVGSPTTKIVFTSKNKGLRANEIRCRVVIVGNCGVTSDTLTSTALSGGLVTDDWTTALGVVNPTEYYYHVSPSSDITNHTFDDLLAQVLTQELPITGIRQVVVTGHVGTQSAASTVAANSAVNTARARIVWQEESELTAGELAASFLAAKALFETTRSKSYNFDGFGATSDTQQFWKVPPQSQQSKWPTGGVTGSINAAVNNGLTPIAVSKGGTGTYVVMDVTTKHKNGANYDYRNRDGHITTVADFYAADVEPVLTETRTGKKLIANPPAGTIPQDPDSVYPALIKARVSHVTDGYANDLKNVETIKLNTTWEVDSTNASRSVGYVPLQVVNLHHQAALLIDDVSSL
jgi:phage tail sheath gpL-like